MPGQIVAAMAIALTANTDYVMGIFTGGQGPEEAKFLAVTLPVFLAGVGLAVSIVCIFIARALRQNAPAMVLRAALIVPSIIIVVVAYILIGRGGEEHDWIRGVAVTVAAFLVGWGLTFLPAGVLGWLPISCRVTSQAASRMPAN